jgi:predicted naringenin-chalcone synthase
MSSPTILFVLKRILEQRAAPPSGDGQPATTHPSGPNTLQPGSHGVAMAFGPGLTIEGALFEWR